MFQSGNSINNEDLSRWKPQWGVRYAGYGSDNTDNRGGRVVIHLGDEEHAGGYYIHRTGDVKIWYKEGEAITVPVQSCQFTKRRDGNWNIYDVFVKNVDIQNGVIMSRNNKEFEGEYVSPKGTKLPEYISPKESAGLWSRLFHTRDAPYWAALFQTEVNTRWDIFNNNLENFSREWETFKETSIEISETADNLESVREEWQESLTSLSNLLNKNTIHEKEMWDKTQKNMRMKGLKVHQKFKDSDVDEVRFNNMTDYIKQYPELQSQRTIDRSVDNVKEKRQEVLNAERLYNEKIKKVNTYLNTAKSKLQRMDHQLKSFKVIRTEGKKKLDEMQKKFLSKLTSIGKTASEKESLKLFLFESDRKIEESEDQLKLMKEDLKKYEKREFRPIVTQKFASIE